MIIEATGMPVYSHLYKGQEEVARTKLLEIAYKQLGGLKYELLIHTGEPAGTILNAEKRTKADLVVMATTGGEASSASCWAASPKSSCANPPAPS